MKQEELVLKLKMVSDIKDAKENFDNIQTLLSKIGNKMPINQFTKLQKIFSEFGNEYKKYTDLVNRPNKSTNSIKQLENSGSKLLEYTRELGRELGKIDAYELDIAPDATKLKALTEQITEVQNKIQTLTRKDFDSFIDKIDALGSKSKILSSLKDALKIGDLSKINDAFKQLDTNSGKFKDSDKIKELVKAWNDWTIATKGTSTELGRALNELQNLDAQVERESIVNQETLNRTLGELVQALVDEESELRKSTKALIEQDSAAAKTSLTIERFKDRILYLVSAANALNIVRRAFNDTYRAVKELDDVMTEMAVVTDLSVGDYWKQLPEYTQRAYALGAAIKDVYASMTLYYQQGLNTEQATALSNATMKMARIAGLQAADATDRMTAAMRGFNMALNETNADNVADVYSALAATSAADVDEISTAMTKVASIAHSANMEFETTSALLTAIIETTRESAETAGTALKTVIARFSEVKKLYSTGELVGSDEDGDEIDVNNISKALRTAGINLNEYLTGAKGLDDIFLELSKKWDSLDNVTQRYIATMAAGSRQQSRFIAMMQNYSRNMELVDTAEKAAGAATEQFNKTLESLDAKLNQLRTQWQSFTTTIFNSNLIKGGVDALTNLLKVINKLTGNSGIAKIGVGVGIFAALRKGVAQLNPLMQRLSLHYKDIATISAKKLNLSDIVSSENEVVSALSREEQLRRDVNKWITTTIGYSKELQNKNLQALNNAQALASARADILTSLGTQEAIERRMLAWGYDQETIQATLAKLEGIQLTSTEAQGVLEETLTAEEKKQVVLEQIKNSTGLVGLAQRSAVAIVEAIITKDLEKQAAIIAWINAHGLVVLAIAVAAIAAVVAVIAKICKNEYDKSLAGINDRWQKQNESLDEAKRKVEELNNELKNTQDRIQELTNKKNSIGLTLEESAELNQLKSQEISLRASLAVAKNDEQKSQQELQETSLEWLNKKKWNGRMEVEEYGYNEDSSLEPISWKNVFPSKEELAEGWEKFAALNREQQLKYAQENQDFIKQSLSQGLIDYNDAFGFLAGKDLELSARPLLNLSQDTDEYKQKLKELSDILGVSQSDFESYLETLKEVDVEHNYSLTNANNKLGKLQQTLSGASEAYQEIQENGQLTVETMLKMTDSIEGLDKQSWEYKNLMEQMANGTQEDQIRAMDALLSSTDQFKNLMMEVQPITEDMTEAERAVAVAYNENIRKQLELMGVTNAAALVNEYATKTEDEKRDALYGVSSALAYEMLQERLQNATASDVIGWNTTQIESFANLTAAIGATAEEVQWLAKVMKALQSGEELTDAQAANILGISTREVAWEMNDQEISALEVVANHYNDYVYKLQRRINDLRYTPQYNGSFGGAAASSSSSGGGSSSAASEWENDYDRLYNLLERIENEQRVLNHLQEVYNDKLKEAGTHNELVENLKEQEASLLRQQKYYEELKRYREQELANAIEAYSGISDLISVVKVGDQNLVHIDWENIDAIDNSDLYDIVQDAEDDYNRIIDSLNEANDKLDTVDDDLIKLRESWRKDIIDFKNRIKEALIKRAQDQIDALENTNKAIDDANKALIDNINTQISEARTQREREEQEQDLADQRRRLAYLMQDTTGANQLEILKLQKEIAEGEQDYTDQLIDDKINELEKQNDEAAAAREKQIEIMQDQLDWFSANGGFWEQVGNLIGNGDDLLPDKEALFELFKNFDNFKGMSEEEQEQFEEELLHDIENVSAELGAYGDEIPNPDVETAINDNGNSYLEGSNESSGATTGNGYTPGHLTDQIAKDVAQTVAAGSWPDYNGWSVWPERERRMNEKFGPGAYDIIQRYIDDIILRGAHYSNNTHATYSSFKTGGLADFTGPAWLDGSKTHPELVLSAKDSENFIQLRDVLSHMYANGTGGTNQTFGDAYYTFQIQVDQLSSDYDVDQIIDRIQKRIEDSSRYRNVNAVNLMR